MNVFDSAAYDGHEGVHFFNDERSGLRAIIAIHSTALGPAAGGCRLWRYDSVQSAATDALRLARGMSYKNAVAGLPLGGGKAVILRDPERAPDESLFEAFGRAVDSLGGRYITAEDVGVGVGEMEIVSRATPHVCGLTREGAVGGDPSPKTAHGVFCGIQAAVASQLGRSDLEGLRVAVQGLGHVGMLLCEELHAAGARLLVSDLNADAVEQACDRFRAEGVPANQILFQHVDVLAPCALGGIINELSIPRLDTRIIAGAANNQLATDADGERIAARGILYAPDYVINAGGIINVSAEYMGAVSEDEVWRKVEAIGSTLADIFARARSTDEPTHRLADALARKLLHEAEGRRMAVAA